MCLVAQLCPTLCDSIDCIVHQAPLSLKFSRQECWSGEPFPFSRGSSHPRSPALKEELSLLSELSGKPGAEAATAKSLQSCPMLCDPIPGILQARTLECVAISFSNA